MYEKKFDSSHLLGCTNIEGTIKKQIYPEVLNTRQAHFTSDRNLTLLILLNQYAKLIKAPDILEQYQNDYGKHLGGRAYAYVKENRTDLNQSLNF